MTREEKVAAIQAAIQDTDKLILVLKTAITNQIPTLEDARIQMACTVLGIDVGESG